MGPNEAFGEDCLVTNDTLSKFTAIADSSMVEMYCLIISDTSYPK